MQILRKVSVLILTILMSSGFCFSQVEDKVLKAFSESYSFESVANYNSAIESIKKVYDENSYPINLRLGWLNYLAGQYTLSMSYYSKCTKLMPLSIEARLGFTYPASAVGNWDQVLTKYEEILKIDKGHYYANLYASQLYLKKKDYKKVALLIDPLLNRYPFTYEVVIVAAWNNYYLGKIREAKVLFQKANYLNPGDASAAEGLKLVGN
jgi:tetratricopeptide (TPR) repeat protein